MIAAEESFGFSLNRFSALERSCLTSLCGNSSFVAMGSNDIMSYNQFFNVENKFLQGKSIRFLFGLDSIQTDQIIG